jgi:hypothetical protein
MEVSVPWVVDIMPDLKFLVRVCFVDFGNNIFWLALELRLVILPLVLLSFEEKDDWGWIEYLGFFFAGLEMVGVGVFICLRKSLSDLRASILSVLSTEELIPGFWKIVFRFWSLPLMFVLCCS